MSGHSLFNFFHEKQFGRFNLRNENDEPTAGVIRYHYTPSNPEASVPTNELNTFLSLHLQTPSLTRIHVPTQPVTIGEWAERTLMVTHPNDAGGEQQEEECMCVILYPKVVLDQSPNMEWIPTLLKTVLAEYDLLQANVSDKKERTSLFHKTFQALYQEAEQQRSEQIVLTGPPSRNASASDLSTSRHSQSISTNKKKKGGKEARVWHDSEQKVTQKTMAKLDRSKNDSNVNLVGDGDQMELDDSSPALREARAAYLPQEHEILKEGEEEDILIDNSEDSNSGAWGSSLKGMLDSISGKVLTESDLDAPFADMEKMLTSKNVAGSIAKEICASVKAKLIGKKMNSFARVKTAVRQGLEVGIQKVLRPGVGRGGSEDVDVLRNVVTLRESGTAGLFRKAAEKTRPYVIVMGKYFEYDDILILSLYHLSMDYSLLFQFSGN